MPLVYPRSIPGSSLNLSAQDSFETSFVDYLQIKIYNSKSGNPYSYIGNSSSDGSKNYGAGKTLGGGGENEGALIETIYLYLPQQLKEQYSTQYQRTTLGAGGVGALDAVATAAAGGETDLVESLKTTAGAAKPQFVMDKIAAAVGTINTALGASGTNLDANSIGALVKKKVFNPYQETTFRGTNYRTHSFSFECQPRSSRESNELYNILNKLRRAMLPSMQDGETGDFTTQGDQAGTSEGDNIVNDIVSGSAPGRWLQIPDYFRLDIIRVEGTPNADGEIELTGTSPRGLKRIMQFPTKLVLKDLNINLSPNGPYNSLKDAFDSSVDYGPASFTMTLTFDETAFLTRESLTQ